MLCTFKHTLDNKRFMKYCALNIAPNAFLFVNKLLLISACHCISVQIFCNQKNSSSLSRNPTVGKIANKGVNMPIQ